MNNINPEIMAHVAQAAKIQAGGDARWCKAIDRAAQEIESNPYLHFANGVLTVLSSTSNNIYDANGACGCKAFEYGKACWHRAGARLLQRYAEAMRHGALWIRKPAPRRRGHFCLACGEEWSCSGEYCCDGERGQICRGCGGAFA